MLAEDCVCLWNTKCWNNKINADLTLHTSRMEIHPCFQRTLQGIQSGWIFTHTSGGWTWELMCLDGLPRWQPGLGGKQWPETRPPASTTTELCPEPQAASDSSWQLIRHTHTNVIHTLFSSVCVSCSVDDPRWFAHNATLKPSPYAVGKNS